MARIALCADVHLGNHRRHGGPVDRSLNRRCWEGLRVFEDAVVAAMNADCDAFVVLGDLFDYRRPEAQLIAEVQRILKGRREAGMRPYLLLGNHEQASGAVGDHALGPLSEVALIVDRPTVFGFPGSVELGLVPFRAEPAKDWLEETVSQLYTDASKTRLLGVHLGVSDRATPPWLQGAPDSIAAVDLAAIANDAGVEHVLAGNWHNRDSFGHGAVTINQLGALVPTGWDNPGMGGYGQMIVVDSSRLHGDLERHWMLGPRFIKLPNHYKPSEDECRRNRVYVEWTTVASDFAAARLEADAKMASGQWVAADVLLLGEETERMARTAANLARAESTLGEALVTYCDNAPMKATVNRAHVAARASHYLARSRAGT